MAQELENGSGADVHSLDPSSTTRRIQLEVPMQMCRHNRSRNGSKASRAVVPNLNIFTPAPCYLLVSSDEGI